MSQISFAMLSGAGVIQGYGELDGEDNRRVYVHTTYDLVVEKEGEDFVAKLTAEDRDNAVIVVSKETPVYPTLLDSAGGQAGYLSAVTDEQITIDGSPDGAVTVNAELGDLDASGCTIVFKLAGDTPGDDRMDKNIQVGQGVRIDCYTVHTEGAQELQIDAETFAGYYYIEASTLFRDEATGEDFPAEFVIPRGKIQSNFTFSMANSGDPSRKTWMAA